MVCERAIIFVLIGLLGIPVIASGGATDRENHLSGTQLEVIKSVSHSVLRAKRSEHDDPDIVETRKRIKVLRSAIKGLKVTIIENPDSALQGTSATTGSSASRAIKHKNKKKAARQRLRDATTALHKHRQGRLDKEQKAKRFHKHLLKDSNKKLQKIEEEANQVLLLDEREGRALLEDLDRRLEVVPVQQGSVDENAGFSSKTGG